MDALIKLLVANEKGQLCDRIGKGFIRKDGGSEVCLKGLTTVLKDRFPRLTRKQFTAARDKNGEKKLSTAKKGKSNIRIGNSFHTRILHRLFCSDAKCVCKRPPSGSPHPIVGRMLNTAVGALAQLKLDPVVGEVVIAPPPGASPVGTRFDLLTRSQTPGGPLVVVSWKTCGACPFPPGSTSGQFGEAVLTSEKVRVKTSEEYMSQRDLAQLGCEIHMLRATHGIEIGGGMIIYLYPNDPSKYRAIWLANHCLPMCGRVWNAVVEGN